MTQLIIAIVWYMSSHILLEMHQHARRKASKDEKIAAISVYGVVAVTCVALLMLMIGGAINGS